MVDIIIEYGEKPFACYPKFTGGGGGGETISILCGLHNNILKVAGLNILAFQPVLQLAFSWMH